MLSCPVISSLPVQTEGLYRLRQSRLRHHLCQQACPRGFDRTRKPRVTASGPAEEEEISLDPRQVGIEVLGLFQIVS